MHRYLFFLGRKDEIGFAELSSVLSRLFNLKPFLSGFSRKIALLDCSLPLEPFKLMDILGGTVKIAVLEKETDKNQVVSEIAKLIFEHSGRGTKINFGISQVNRPDSSYRNLFPKSVKAELAAQGIQTRFVLPKKSDEITSAQVKLANLVEFYLIWEADHLLLARTVAVQDFEQFAARDYRRPYIDPKSGMLPPKVARIMINLVLPNKSPQDIWLLDPFCGTGTIGLEAMAMGINSFNSDLSLEQVEGTNANLNWLQTRLASTTRWKTIQSDVNLLPSLIDVPIDCVVTEPYLGPADLSQKNLKNIVKGLNKLYLGALKKIHTVLPVGGKVAFVFPQLIHGPIIKEATLAIDRREKLGYTLDAGPFAYERENSRVKRLIYVLKKS